MGARIEWPGFCGDTNDNSTQNGVFWDDNSTINTDQPDLTECFQQTALVWTPCAILWASAVLYLPYLHKQPTRRKGWRSRSWINIIKLISGVLVTLLGISNLLYILHNTNHHVYAPSVYVSSSVVLCTYILAMIISDTEHRKGFHTSGVLVSFWTLYLLLGIVRFRSLIMKAQKQEVSDWITFGLFYAQFAMVVVLFLANLLCDYGAPIPSPSSDRAPLLETKAQETEDIYKDTRDPCPEDRASFISRITFSWITRLILKGYRTPLTFSNLYQMKVEDKCNTLMPVFNQQRNKSRSHPPPLVWPLVKATLGSFVITAISRCMENIFVIAGPLILRELISFVASGDPYVWKGYFLAVSLFLVKVLGSLFLHNSLKFGFLTGQRVRSILISAVYKKALRLSHKARKGATVGQIVNLMSVDTQRIQDEVKDLHEFWACPMMIALSLYLLWTTVGPAALAGFGVLIIMAPINGFIGARGFVRLQAEQMMHKDSRIELLSEMLSGIKVLKFYAWEPSFSRKVYDIREKELKTIKKAGILGILFGITWAAAPYLVSLATFAAYILTKEDKILPPEVAFVSLNIINLLQFSTSFVPIYIAFAAQAWTSFKRVQKMLNQEELDPDSVEENYSMDAAVRMENGTFSWDDDDNVILENINLDIGHGKLVAVVGHVGCGKSSLLNALLGEMRKLQGRVFRQGTTAYIPQQAWIQNMTLKDNILFGSKEFSQRYNEVINACALEPDLDILPARDMTEIGEKGINLSGGQKQRVNLARAIYQDCDIYLLDDVMSAVDAHVGKHIFRHVIGPTGFLKHKTRLLVTHGVTYLPEMDYIIAMKDGCIAESGTYLQLLEQNGAFAEFIRNYLEETRDEEKDEEELIIIKTLQRQLSRTSESEVDGETTNHRKRRKRKVSTRISSSISANQPQEDNKERDLKKAQLIVEEQEILGNVSGQVILSYIKSAGSTMVILMVLSTALYTASMVSTNIWLRLWSDDQLTPNIADRAAQSNLRLGVYGVFGVGQVLGVAVLNAVIYFGGVNASRKLHSGLTDRVLQAPMAFFDTTPLGRIINRFSNDMDKADNSMPPYIRAWVSSLASCLTSIISIVYSIPMFLVALLPIVILFILVQRLYITAARQIQRIHSVRKSPMIAHFDETLVGVTTVRAYRKQTDFSLKNEHLVDNSQSTWYLKYICQRPRAQLVFDV